MKHADVVTLSAIGPLLAALRATPRLVERTPGCFYFRSKAYLHFHDDEAGPFADVKLDLQRFERLPVKTAAQQMALIARIERSLES